ncbi:hypothetical protein B0H14DRAFT_2562886 [Mycena olivaceomarginata]|nr:hypothetical protein B0H14DRAFT_2562886 [Mycena olivaceomarginata]
MACQTGASITAVTWLSIEHRIKVIRNGGKRGSFDLTRLTVALRRTAHLSYRSSMTFAGLLVPRLTMGTSFSGQGIDGYYGFYFRRRALVGLNPNATVSSIEIATDSSAFLSMDATLAERTENRYKTDLCGKWRTDPGSNGSDV